MPAPGGSKTAFPFRRKDGSLGARVTDAGKNNKPWRDSVSAAAVAAMRRGPSTNPVRVKCLFFRPRPKGHYRQDGWIKMTAPRFPTTRPDATKLWRAAEDALTGIVWVDDSQVIEQHIYQFYADGRPPGMLIEVREAVK